MLVPYQKAAPIKSLGLHKSEPIKIDLSVTNITFSKPNDSYNRPKGGILWE
jgi:hypothetical protein